VRLKNDYKRLLEKMIWKGISGKEIIDIKKWVTYQEMGVLSRNGCFIKK